MTNHEVQRTFFRVFPTTTTTKRSRGFYEPTTTKCCWFASGLFLFFLRSQRISLQSWPEKKNIFPMSFLMSSENCSPIWKFAKSRDFFKDFPLQMIFLWHLTSRWGHFLLTHLLISLIKWFIPRIFLSINTIFDQIIMLLLL